MRKTPTHALSVNTGRWGGDLHEPRLPDGSPGWGVGVMSQESGGAAGLSRRTMLRLGAAGGVGVALAAAEGVGGPLLAQKGLLSPDGAFAATSTELGDLLFYIEAFPTSPLIVSASLKGDTINGLVGNASM